MPGVLLCNRDESSCSMIPNHTPTTHALHPLAVSFVLGIGEDEVLSCMVICSASDKLQHLSITLENDTCVLLLMLVIELQQLLKTCEQVFPHLSALLQVCLCRIFSAQENSKAWLDVEGVQGLMGTVGEVQLSTGDLELHVIQNWWSFVSQGFFSLLEAAFQLITTAMSSKVTLCQAGGRESRFWMGPFKELRSVCAQMCHVGKDRCPGGDTHQVALSFQC